MQVGVHAVDPDKIAASVATTATTFSVLLVLVIGVPFSLWLDVCLIGCYSRDRRSGSKAQNFFSLETPRQFVGATRKPTSSQPYEPFALPDFIHYLDNHPVLSGKLQAPQRYSEIPGTPATTLRALLWTDGAGC